VNARRADTVSFWVSIVFASIAVSILGFQLAAADVSISTSVFAIFWSWMGLYLGLNHLYAVARRAKDGAS
jgi:hypothetical protein